MKNKIKWALHLQDTVIELRKKVMDLEAKETELRELIQWHYQLGYNLSAQAATSPRSSPTSRLSLSACVSVILNCSANSPPPACFSATTVVPVIWRGFSASQPSQFLGQSQPTAGVRSGLTFKC